MFPDFGRPLRAAVNAIVDTVVTRWGASGEAATEWLLRLIVALEQALRALPPWAVIIAASGLAFLASRRLAAAAAVGVQLWLIGSLGLWEPAMQTVALMGVAVLLAVAIGLPLGIAAAKSRALRTVVTPVLDFMQTIPSFVYLLPTAMVLGLGKIPALIATVVFAAPPLVRLTGLGLSQVDRSLVEAATVLGHGPLGRLLRVELPLAWPSILQGINQTVMMALGMVVIASMIGARGLGEAILVGFQRNDAGAGMVAGLSIVLLAMTFDRIGQALGAGVSRRSRIRAAPENRA